ncbi:hypothetical protein F511_33769 [Dorcoceras hygrometricum]|uniref:Uncharacterized protein n=1 Tax=Dorcoceras hygrometricum TaxID=472368 RepID=A0A2Z7BCK0_9LAMI|nr:hypothetical protein F511_33769 [Dorcoceras hygrometricum]
MHMQNPSRTPTHATPSAPSLQSPMAGAAPAGPTPGCDRATIDFLDSKHSPLNPFMTVASNERIKYALKIMIFIDYAAVWSKVGGTELVFLRAFDLYQFGSLHRRVDGARSSCRFEHLRDCCPIVLRSLRSFSYEP